MNAETSQNRRSRWVTPSRASPREREPPRHPSERLSCANNARSLKLDIAESDDARCLNGLCARRGRAGRNRCYLATSAAVLMLDALALAPP